MCGFLPWGKDSMIWSMNIIIFIFRLTCISWIISWEQLYLSLPDFWGLNLACIFSWFWKHLLDIHLKILSEFCSAWYLVIALAHGNNRWLEFQFSHWLDWWLALKKDIWWNNHWDFYLDTQILELFLMELWWKCFLGLGLALNRSCIGVTAATSRITTKVLAGWGRGDRGYLLYLYL